jgi:hypothetical protein
MNLSSEQRRLFQEYLYDRNPAYRKQVDKFRNQWAAAKGDAERNIVARKARIHLSGEFGEQIVRHALAPLAADRDAGRTLLATTDGTQKLNFRLPTYGFRSFWGVVRAWGAGGRLDGIRGEMRQGGIPLLAEDHMIFRPKGTSKQMRNALFAHETSTICQPEKQKELRDACAKLARRWWECCQGKMK